jgi:hypothetical protein
MSGTALPASAVITSSDQVAAVVIDGHHVRQHSLTKDDVEDVYLRVRVDAAGNVIGEGNDGTAVREQLATYRVTFNSEALDGSSPRGPRDLSNCAVTATPTMTGMENVPYQPQEVLGPTTLIVTRKTLPGLNSIPPLGPNSVRVQSLKPRVQRRFRLDGQGQRLRRHRGLLTPSRRAGVTR